MTSSEIRQSFLDFFRSKQHTIVPSSSLLPDSPNLLFTNAGMNQFVPIFLGQQKCPFNPPRAADTQKCIRAGGKHNDLEDVGLDTYHHTFFEMLGNWSFGDYFKKEAIEWAWELVTGIWKFPKERLYATVYNPDRTKGDPSDFDQEAHDHWARLFTAAGLDPKVHIVNGGKKDNFWMMGETGPCGPCSEIHVDLTPEGDTRGSLVNKGDARCIEIWNLVFIQFNANPDGTFTPLPARHVDTGMGFERVTSIIQGTKNFTDFKKAKISNYETDIFRPIFSAIEKLSGKRYRSTLPVSGSATVPVASVGVPPTESAKTLATQLSAAAPAQATYYKRRLPHFERPWAKYIVTFSTRERRKLSEEAKSIVLKSLLFGHEQRRYELFAACVMPDHVHFLFEPQIKEQDKDGKPVFWSLTELLHSVKSFTAHEVNKVEKQDGQLWENESFDRLIRGDADFEEKFHYICRNPWDSGIVSPAENYLWLWTPEVSERSSGTGSATVPVASVGVPPTESALTPRVETSVQGRSNPSEAVARDAQQSDRDGRAPYAPEQIQIDIAFRVIADHIRTLSFAIADGIQPGNTDRNYVLRRILRRAVRYGRTLGFHEPFFYKLVDVLAETMGDVFPEIRTRKQRVRDVMRVEEEAFNKTLDRGIELFDEVVSRRDRQQLEAVINTLPAEDAKKYLAQLETGDLEAIELPLDDPKAKGAYEAFQTFPADEAFKLYDTYGFPLDLTELMARERGLTVDTAGFEKLMDEQRARARKAQKREVISVNTGSTDFTTKFVGYSQLEANARVLSVLNFENKQGLIVDTSPFYAEMGGQVGDSGVIIDDAGGKHVVRNTLKVDQAFVLYTDIGAPDVGDEVCLQVDQQRRNAIQRHHTVTHLLHWALHEVVTRDASQKGSYVGPEKLTFDFNAQALTPQQVADIEKLVNERILENAAVSWFEVPYAEIKSRKDVMQFFGEKYGDTVRVVQIGGEPKALNGYSMELCGGTHTRATGEIGLFRIVGENAIAAGVRRIEAVAGLEAYNVANQQLQLIRNVAGKINSPVHELEKKVEALLHHQRELERQLKSIQQKQAGESARSLIAKTQTIGSTPAIIDNLGSTDGDYLQAIAEALKGQFKGVLILAAAGTDAVALVATVSPEYTSKVQAGKIIQTIAPIVGGKGGGRPDFARGGGKDASRLNEALTKASELLKSLP